MARRNRVNGQAQADSEDENSNTESDTPDTDDTVAFVDVRNKKRGRGRPKNPTKRKRIVVNSDQDDSDDDGSPQPSTSGINTQQTQVNGTQNSSNRESSYSGEESPDSDNMPVDDNRDFSNKVTSTTTAKKRGRPQQKAIRSSPRTKRKKPNYSANGVKNSSKRGAKRLSSIFQSLNLSQNKSSKGSQPKDAFDSKVVESSAQKCAYFLLIEDQKKHAIKRKAIVQHVFKDEAYTPKLYTAVIHKANQILKKTYGMELMELENQKDSYLIVNILKREYGVEDYVEMPRIKHQQHGLVLYLLTIIYMNDNCITEAELIRALKNLGLDFSSRKPHPVFGDIKKYITVELVKQMYLNYECINKDPPQYEITWGLRAKEEIDKMDLLQFACKIMDDTSPENWILQYKDAVESASPE